jgi:YfiH family protein
MIQKGYSEKSDGNMYLSGEGFDPENVANRERYFGRIGLTEKKIVAANLIHGTHVAIIDTSSPEFLLDTDALVTKEKNIVLTLTGADCFPVYFEDAAHDIIGLVHCGWRGITGGILRETIEIIESLGGTLGNISVTIGPGICGKHFEIKEDILGNFSEYPEALIREGERVFIDLRTIMKIQLERLGIPTENTIDSGECTQCLTGKYFSYRRDKPEQLETQVAHITQ